MKPAKIKIKLGILGAATLDNVEQEHRYVSIHNCRILYDGYTTGFRINIVDGGFSPYIWDDILVIPVNNLKNYQEIMCKEK